MQLDFADESLRLLCSTQESLMLAFGPAWTSVARCLTILHGVESLAEVAAFAVVVLCQVITAIENAVEFMITYGSVRIQFRSLDVAGAILLTSEGSGALALVRTVSIVNVSLVPVVVRA